jgi:hypothetical protein
VSDFKRTHYRNNTVVAIANGGISAGTALPVLSGSPNLGRTDLLKNNFLILLTNVRFQESDAMLGMAEIERIAAGRLSD